MGRHLRVHLHYGELHRFLLHPHLCELGRGSLSDHFHDFGFNLHFHLLGDASNVSVNGRRDSLVKMGRHVVFHNLHHIAFQILHPLICFRRPSL